ncbi:hypothetical protein [Arthrobacter cavernae]|uniref:Uncharacterized protein n=1 Tax=Arthrobacter cavernae TaxID=2817681 RepID=A0A939HHR6_9MICC|nr:hypothetical protein [Arthrobacter cavernae]MBO1267533.1 hypothetical protein [Arthrobacter cavernae]
MAFGLNFVLFIAAMVGTEFGMDAGRSVSCVNDDGAARDSHPDDADQP